MTHPLPQPLAEALGVAADRWASLPQPWLVGGSCGLAFHGVRIDAAPRDLDVYVDVDGASAFHRALAAYATDEQQCNVTERYRSTLSHYTIRGVVLELVAGFEVRAEGALYRIDIAGLLLPYAATRELEGARVRVAPLAHELAFNLLRERSDRYERIAEAMRADLSAHLPALRRLVAANVFDERWRARMRELLGLPADAFAGGEEANVCRD
ncbi:hypothetical protein [Paenibacillus sp.]|uniref:hypothetical protein n=1 Tax=Paenibacillus sp. TaxID=58172 RepID=UPI002D6322B9|nr:hypothetical protein [Paenibacillus sp.]HZG57476.1 hypothetical protein [Paenibacillus sp.]